MKNVSLNFVVNWTKLFEVLPAVSNFIEETYPPLLLYIVDVDEMFFHMDEIRFLRQSYHHLK